MFFEYVDILFRNWWLTFTGSSQYEETLTSMQARDAFIAGFTTAMKTAGTVAEEQVAEDIKRNHTELVK